MELILELLLLSGVARTLEVLSGRSSLLRVEEINLAMMVLVSVIGFDCQTSRSTVLHNRVTQVHLLPGPNAIIVIEGLQVFNGWDTGRGLAGWERGQSFLRLSLALDRAMALN
jgi:hypothetical protein